MIKVKLLLFLAIFTSLISSCTQSKVSNPPLSDTTLDVKLSNKNNEEYNYKFNYDIISANDIMNYQQINFPKEIEGNRVSLTGLLNQDLFLVLLYTEVNIPIIHELGIYDLPKKTYKKLHTFKTDELFKICDFNNEYIVLQKTTNDWVDKNLYLISLNDSSIELLHSYSKEHSLSSANKNSILIKENKVYFDDINTKENDVNIDLYCYDFITKEKQVIKEDMQNPIKLKDNVLAIGKNTNGEFDTIKSLESNFELKIENELIEFNSNNNSLYSIINKCTNKKGRFTVLALMNMIENKEIFETAMKIDQVSTSSHFVAWRNMDINNPYLYSVKDNKIIKFDIAPGYNSFFIKNNYGILLNTIYDKPEDYYQNMKYYFFQYK
ncbi:hypothetical protein [Vallitalea guaymasensis]|uniref:hypothetical protein n=1 Tax=Vallitalea guaymasensis TaxID=1185412 RepID=UPI000DE3F43F|nr:hypothetical protein [Vallitalea guaymasensis]